MKKIGIIQALRFFGAIAVYLAHCYYFVFQVGGAFAVELFMIISGYITVLATRSEEAKSSFLQKRLIRIVPLYWLLTFFMFAIIYVYPALSIGSEPVPSQLVRSLFFIPFMNSRGFDGPILGVGWTLNYEMFFYVIFLAAMLICHRHRALLAAAVCTGLVLLGALVRPENFYLRYYTNSFLLEFVMGIAAYYLLQYLVPKLRNAAAGWRWALGLASVLAFLYLVTDTHADDVFPRAVTAGIPAFICFFCAMLAWSEAEVPAVLVKLGDMSYSFYLIEIFTAKAYTLLAAGRSFFVQTVLVLAILAVTLISSRVAYELFEVRLTNWLRRKCLKAR